MTTGESILRIRRLVLRPGSERGLHSRLQRISTTLLPLALARRQATLDLTATLTVPRMIVRLDAGLADADDETLADAWAAQLIAALQAEISPTLMGQHEGAREGTPRTVTPLTRGSGTVNQMDAAECIRRSSGQPDDLPSSGETHANEPALPHHNASLTEPAQRAPASSHVVEEVQSADAGYQTHAPAAQDLGADLNQPDVDIHTNVHSWQNADVDFFTPTAVDQKRAHDAQSDHDNPARLKIDRAIHPQNTLRDRADATPADLGRNVRLDDHHHSSAASPTASVDTPGGWPTPAEIMNCLHLACFRQGRRPSATESAAPITPADRQRLDRLRQWHEQGRVPWAHVFDFEALWAQLADANAREATPTTINSVVAKALAKELYQDDSSSQAFIPDVHAGLTLQPPATNLHGRSTTSIPPHHQSPPLAPIDWRPLVTRSGASQGPPDVDQIHAPTDNQRDRTLRSDAKASMLKRPAASDREVECSTSAAEAAKITGRSDLHSTDRLDPADILRLLYLPDFRQQRTATASEIARAPTPDERLRLDRLAHLVASGVVCLTEIKDLEALWENLAEPEISRDVERNEKPASLPTQISRSPTPPASGKVDPHDDPVLFCALTASSPTAARTAITRLLTSADTPETNHLIRTWQEKNAAQRVTVLLFIAGAWPSQQVLSPISMAAVTRLVQRIGSDTIIPPPGLTAAEFSHLRQVLAALGWSPGRSGQPTFASLAAAAAGQVATTVVTSLASLIAQAIAATLAATTNASPNQSPEVATGTQVIDHRSRVTQQAVAVQNAAGTAPRARQAEIAAPRLHAHQPKNNANPVVEIPSRTTPSAATPTKTPHLPSHGEKSVADPTKVESPLQVARSPEATPITIEPNETTDTDPKPHFTTEGRDTIDGFTKVDPPAFVTAVDADPATSFALTVSSFASDPTDRMQVTESAAGSKEKENGTTGTDPEVALPQFTQPPLAPSQNFGPERRDTLMQAQHQHEPTGDPTTPHLGNAGPQNATPNTAATREASALDRSTVYDTHPSLEPHSASITSTVGTRAVPPTRTPATPLEYQRTNRTTNSSDGHHLTEQIEATDTTYPLNTLSRQRNPETSPAPNPSAKTGQPVHPTSTDTTQRTQPEQGELDAPSEVPKDQEADARPTLDQLQLLGRTASHPSMLAGGHGYRPTQLVRQPDPTIEPIPASPIQDDQAADKYPAETAPTALPAPERGSPGSHGQRLPVSSLPDHIPSERSEALRTPGTADVSAHQITPILSPNSTPPLAVRNAAAATGAVANWRSGRSRLHHFCLTAGQAGLPLAMIARELLHDRSRLMKELVHQKSESDGLIAIALVAAGRIRPASLDQAAVITEDLRWLHSAAAARVGVRPPWSGTTPTVDEVLALFERTTEPRAVASPTTATPHSPALITMASAERLSSSMGGLVLLHPWLAPAMREVVASFAAENDDAIFRARGELLLLAVPSDVAANGWSDPLLRLLIGLDPTGTNYPKPLRSPTEVAALLTTPVHRLLRSFANAVPGLRAHSDMLIRDYFMRRTARLRHRGTAWDIALGRNQLDVLMATSPVPLGMVKLPWTPLLELHFDDDGAGPVTAGPKR